MSYLSLQCLCLKDIVVLVCCSQLQTLYFRTHCRWWMLNKSVGFMESETGQNIIKVGKAVGQIGVALFQANANRKANQSSYNNYDSYDYYDDEY